MNHGASRSLSPDPQDTRRANQLTTKDHRAGMTRVTGQGQLPDETVANGLCTGFDHSSAVATGQLEDRDISTSQPPRRTPEASTKVTSRPARHRATAEGEIHG
jgi:hypothetical protein